MSQRPRCLPWRMDPPCEREAAALWTSPCCFKMFRLCSEHSLGAQIELLELTRCLVCQASYTADDWTITDL